MSINISQYSLFPIRRDGQIVGSVSGSGSNFIFGNNNGTNTLQYIDAIYSEVSSTVRLSSDSEESDSSQAAWKLLKSITLPYSFIPYTNLNETYTNSTIQISFDLRSGNGNPAKAKLYCNGVAFGTERMTISTDYTTYTETFAGSWNKNDTIEIWIWTVAASSYIRNFKIYFDPIIYSNIINNLSIGLVTTLTPGLDYKKYTLFKNSSLNGYVLDLPMLCNDTSTIFYYEASTNSVRFTGNIYADGEVAAYTSNPNAPTLWDGLKFLREASLGTGFAWVGNYLTATGAGGDVTKTYVDASLTYRDTSISNIWSKIGSVNTSLNNLGISNGIQDSSITWLKNNFGLYIKSASIGDHLAFTDGILNVTIDEDGFAKTVNVNSSTNAIWSKLGSVDTSLNNLGVKNGNQDTSLNNLGIKNGYQDTSISWLDANKVNKAGDGMTGPLHVIGDVSITGTLYANGDVVAFSTGVGTNFWDQMPGATTEVLGGVRIGSGIAIDASFRISASTGLGDATKTYVDGSLATRDSSITWLYVNKQVTGDYVKGASIGNVSGGVLAYRTFGTAANNDTGDFLADDGTAIDSNKLAGKYGGEYVYCASIGSTVLAYRTFGTAANNNTGDFDAAGTGHSEATAHISSHESTYNHSNYNTAYTWVNTNGTNVTNHLSNTSNPHSVTATQVSLGNVTNESKATMFSGPTFTGHITHNDSAAHAFIFQNAASTKAYMALAYGANDWISGSVANDLTFRTNGFNTLFSNDSGSTTHLFCSSLGKIGIGTTNPFKGQLHINNSNAGGLGGDLWITNSGTNTVDSYCRLAFGPDATVDATPNIGIESIMTNTTTYTSDLAFKIYDGDGYNEKVRFKADGKVGIGTSTPKSKLTVAIEGGYYPGTSTSTPLGMIVGSNPEFAILDTGNAGGNTATLRLGTCHTDYYTYGAYVQGVETDGVDHYKLQFGTSHGSAATTKMTLNEDGRLGIGIAATASATTWLHVNGVSGTGSSYMRLASVDNDNFIGFGATSAATHIYSRKTSDGTAQALKFDIGGTDQVFISSTGNFGVGIDPTYKIQADGIVCAGEGATGGFRNRVYSSGQNLIWAFGNASGYGMSYQQGTHDDIRFHFGSYASPEFTFDTDGNLTAEGEVTAYYSSDERLKYNIKSFSALDIINKIKPVSFKWNDKAKKLNPSKDDRVNYGIIAQQIEDDLPELIHPIYEDYKAVDYVQLVPILIQAIKEQQKQIDELKKDLNYNKNYNT